MTYTTRYALESMMGRSANTEKKPAVKPLISNQFLSLNSAGNGTLMVRKLISSGSQNTPVQNFTHKSSSQDAR